MKSVLDNPTLAEQIKAKIKSILDDVTGDADKDLTLFGDPLIRTKLQSVLDDFYARYPENQALAYSALGEIYLEQHSDQKIDDSTLGEEFILEHFGVKGMHWGVRRENRREARLKKRGAQEMQRRADPNRAPSPIRVTDTIGRSSNSKTKLKAVGGEDHPAHQDAVKVAVARQKLKKSGIHTLSNAELQAMNQRMQLEAQVHSLNSKRQKSKGQGFVDAHLARAQKDPIGTVMKAHRFKKDAKKFVSTAAVAATL